ncbi:MAG: diguanylate phosphodiesterase [Nitrospirae bacterium CG18_big_fil_WC_8_21_14_2_50_70_55]|nr:HDOD domain-containing protein [Deltaproteobacteria bacterium]OIP66234.1 MAG: hypothetical protein AUK30_02855 [Nitrospirae bacterium CG2_30_70_394]PIQ03152.1 MAG: diguanylate phosphodiesterase [Nitrospirae bacterium CG18_big_fil_WC_8_21_14_2_50_70_55]PIW82323.1 MAG: diguanylate phosphodiesterase [Nitrospirae bacterium CG_4_8_14_3_um_filter_70_85]PIX83753.1 MAG: diguanylate phosphodiesterase [Nitrospirae bacterium CG_4_10_14_3_um_filter_70_108]PJB95787.1 MAG: diguanylate phosphodiesterase [
MNVFLARQPIFDRQGEVVAYELLYRGGAVENAGQRGARATAQVLLNTFGTFGIERVTGGKRAFVNLTRSLLVSEYATLLPAAQVVIEVLEDVEPDEAVVGACRSLVHQGYTLALDDFVFQPRFVPLLEVVQIVKVDLNQIPAPELATQIALLAPYRCQLLAEKVETQAEHQTTLDLGFDLFQGYYFARPSLLQQRREPTASLAVMRSMRHVLTATQLDEMGAAIGADLALSYRLLRLINSAAFGLIQEVSSVRQALALLGLVAVKKWLALILLTEVGSDKPVELLRLALTRGRMMELLAQNEGKPRAAQAFTIGLFSTLDAFLDQPMAEAIAPLGFPEENVEAILHHRGPLGRLLAILLAYERADWPAVAAEACSLSLSEEALTSAYVAAVEWSETTFGAWE